MLDANLKAQLQGHLQRMSAPVEISFAGAADAASGEMRALLEELAALHPGIRLRDDPDPAARRPSFGIARPGEAPRIRFAAVPLGHEFTSLVLALLQVGGVAPKVESMLLERARALEGEWLFETYVSLSCQVCPEVVQALNVLAVTHPGVRHTMIDGALFEPEVQARDVLAVPSVWLNGAPFVQGRVDLRDILARLDAGAGARAATELGQRAPYDLLVVGGGPAGAAAAIYAARKGIRTGLVAERLGGQVRDTLGIENFISVPSTEGPRLAAGLEEHVRAYGVELIEGQRAQALRPGEIASVELASGATLRARSVVVASGARWRELGVPGEREYRGRGVAYCPHCDGPLFRGKRVAVVGGGNSGEEAAIDLAGIAAEVTLIEFDGRLRADAVLQQRLASLANVRVIVGAATTAVRGDGRRVTGLAWRERGSGAEHALELEGIFVQIGLVPNTDWLRGALALNARGEIEVDASGRTSVAGVFAAGDATTVPYKQIIIAMGEGAKAALGAFDHLIRTPLPGAAPRASIAA
ncbi:MAG: alkyl hydroperoxide reductase subunit F [Gammaproteobacteria bacterium]|nr:alkyl hydroperoxide reductase subunit F [Gammaproteobacteria bacterium]